MKYITFLMCRCWHKIKFPIANCWSMKAEKDSTPQSSSNVHHLPNCTHQNEWVPDPGLWQGWDGRSIMMLEPSGFCGDRGSGLLALCSIMPRGPFYPFSAPRPTGQSWSHKGASKISPTDNARSKITSFTSPFLLIGLPLGPVQNTRNPSSRKFAGETNRNLRD